MLVTNTRESSHTQGYLIAWKEVWLLGNQYQGELTYSGLSHCLERGVVAREPIPGIAHILRVISLLGKRRGC